MQITQYIVVRKRKTYSRSTGYYSSRMTVENPALDASEVAVKVTLELPDAAFEKPAFSAKIVVPKEAVSSPVIEASVVDNVQEMIRQGTGFDVKLEVVEPKSEER